MTTSSQPQQFQLKLAVVHHQSLKTEQLIQFLESQANEFLSNDLPNSITQDHFFTVFQMVGGGGAVQPDLSDHIGLLLLYSTSILDSFEYIKKRIPNKPQEDLFIIVVEMDNTEKKTNVIGEEGERLCARMGCQFVRLNLFNSQDLVACLHRNLYELIQNYYYPNQQQRVARKTNQPQYVFHYSQDQHQSPTLSNQISTPLTLKKQLQHQSQSQEDPSPSPQPYIEQDSHSHQQERVRILATKEEHKSYQRILEKASELRESRNVEILQEQREIDQSIQNVENVLAKINENVSRKLNSNWYTSLNHTLYSPLQKNSNSYAKIKLTQQFLEDTPQPELSVGMPKKPIKQPSRPSRTAFINKFLAKHHRLQPILKILLTLSDSVVVQLELHQESQFHQVTMLALRKTGIQQTEKNYQIMKQMIVSRVEEFVKQLARAVKQTEKMRLDQRSFLRPYSNPPTPQQYRSNSSTWSHQKAE